MHHTDLTAFTKITSEWITDLNVKYRNSYSTGKSLDALDYANNCSDTAPKQRPGKRADKIQLH